MYFSLFFVLFCSSFYLLLCIRLFVIANAKWYCKCECVQILCVTPTVCSAWPMMVFLFDFCGKYRVSLTHTNTHSICFNSIFSACFSSFGSSITVKKKKERNRRRTKVTTFLRPNLRRYVRNDTLIYTLPTNDVFDVDWFLWFLLTFHFVLFNINIVLQIMGNYSSTKLPHEITFNLTNNRKLIYGPCQNYCTFFSHLCLIRTVIYARFCSTDSITFSFHWEGR